MNLHLCIWQILYPKLLFFVFCFVFISFRFVSFRAVLTSFQLLSVQSGALQGLCIGSGHCNVIVRVSDEYRYVSIITLTRNTNFQKSNYSEQNRWTDTITQTLLLWILSLRPLKISVQSVAPELKNINK